MHLYVGSQHILGVADEAELLMMEAGLLGSWQTDALGFKVVDLVDVGVEE